MAESRIRVIFQNQHYMACVVIGGYLTVESLKKKHGRRGISLRGNDAMRWADVIETSASFDRGEASALCRALLNQ